MLFAASHSFEFGLTVFVNLSLVASVALNVSAIPMGVSEIC